MKAKKENLSKLTTERPNPASTNLDLKSSLQIARIINSEDAKVAKAVKRALPQIAKAIDVVTSSLRQGGRLIYVGTGTSGRMGALDSAECPPTFQTDPRMVQYVIAGGLKALGEAVEADEDSREFGAKEIARKKPSRKDVVVGIAASGRTPFTIAAVEYARRHGATTVAVVCNRNSELGRAAEIEIVVEVGPEVVSGSTRMKAGTAQKMVLNMLTTGAMTRLGHVYGNLMVNVKLKNAKLAERGITILQRATNVSRDKAASTLKDAGDSVPTAMVMLQSEVSRALAEKALKQTSGHVRNAIALAKKMLSAASYRFPAPAKILKLKLGTDNR